MILHVQWTLRQDDPHPSLFRVLSDQDISISSLRPEACCPRRSIRSFIAAYPYWRAI
jgi:hypothetical protein